MEYAYDEVVKERVSFVTALLAVVMLGIGTCCCGGTILAAEVNVPKDECCAEKSAAPVHKEDCHCPGRVLIDAKQGASFALVPPVPVSYISGALNASPRQSFAPRCVFTRMASAMEHPPPREVRRWLGVWMV